LFVGFAFPAQSQTPSNEIQSRVDAVISAAYESASVRFPCRLKSGGKPKMLRWQDVAKCLNYANDSVDWEDVSQQLQKIRRDFRLELNDIISMAESSFAAQALPYERVFVVRDVTARLPLSSTLLKFLPEGSLQGLPVFDNSGKEVGTFSGLYQFDKSASISGTRSPLTLFQYTDAKGDIHGPPEKLLLDSFGVPWEKAVSQPGFRLPSYRIVLK
jgi:hypothetical protein